MGVFIMESGMMGRGLELGCSSLMMGRNMKGNGFRGKDMVMEDILGNREMFFMESSVRTNFWMGN